MIKLSYIYNHASTNSSNIIVMIIRMSVYLYLYLYIFLFFIYFFYFFYFFSVYISLSFLCIISFFSVSSISFETLKLQIRRLKLWKPTVLLLLLSVPGSGRLPSTRVFRFALYLSVSRGVAPRPPLVYYICVTMYVYLLIHLFKYIYLRQFKYIYLYCV